MEVHLGEVHWQVFVEQRWLSRAVVAFLRERRGGALVLGNPPEQMEDRMRRITTLPDEFWENRIAEDVCEGLSYCFGGDMQNPHWGEIRPAWHPQWREEHEK